MAVLYIYIYVCVCVGGGGGGGGRIQQIQKKYTTTYSFEDNFPSNTRSSQTEVSPRFWVFFWGMWQGGWSFCLGKTSWPNVSPQQKGYKNEETNQIHKSRRFWFKPWEFVGPFCFKKVSRQRFPTWLRGATSEVSPGGWCFVMMTSHFLPNDEQRVATRGEQNSSFVSFFEQILIGYTATTITNLSNVQKTPWLVRLFLRIYKNCPSYIPGFHFCHEFFRIPIPGTNQYWFLSYQGLKNEPCSSKQWTFVLGL